MSLLPTYANPPYVPEAIIALLISSYPMLGLVMSYSNILGNGSLAPVNMLTAIKACGLLFPSASKSTQIPSKLTIKLRASSAELHRIFLNLHSSRDNSNCRPSCSLPPHISLSSIQASFLSGWPLRWNRRITKAVDPLVRQTKRKKNDSNISACH